MKEFLVSEKYRLEIHWDEVLYDKEDLFRLKGCYLSGPVIKEVAKMNQEDAILLDLTKQYILFVPLYYIARFSWKRAEHKGDRVFLGDVIIKNENVSVVPKLKNDDYFVVDTKNHEDEKHLDYLTYDTYLLNAEGILYNFNK